ncbi:MAG: arsenate reductase ArsC [Ectothiorhodospiraceae bacterium]
MNILFVCTHNRCRSILCEALANHLGGGRLRAFSAGSQPAGEVHPQTLGHLKARGVPTSGLHSKSWDVFVDEPLDVVITVCDSAASEACPLRQGDAVTVHWGLPDPSRTSGSQAAVDAAFYQVIEVIERRIGRLLGLQFGALDPPALRRALQAIANKEN